MTGCTALLTDTESYRDVDEAVVRFDSDAHAQAVVVATIQTWTRCAGSVLTISSSGRTPREIRLGAPATVRGVAVVSSQSMRVHSCGGSHAMRALGMW
jgi:hypothetical protein